MKILKLCIREPVIAIVLSLLLCVLGLGAFFRLDMRYLPKLTIPIVTISTSYDGASAALMESNVTTLLEGQLASINGIEYMSSSSSTSSSSITIQFKMGGDFNEEVNQVRDKVSAARAEDAWPADAKPPAINIGMNDPPLMYLSFTDKSKNDNDIRDYLINNVAPQLRQVTGVAAANAKGGSTYAMRIWLNPEEMTALGITVQDVETALSSQNIDISGGSIRGPTRSYSIVSNTRLKNPQQFENIILKQSSAGTVKLSDIANVSFMSSSFDIAPMRVNGQDAIMLQIVPLQGVNPIQLDSKVRKELQTIQQHLPAGMKMQTLYDSSNFLKGSVNDTFKTIAEAIILVIIVVFLFLGSLRAAIIPIITIPVSLIGVFALIYIFGFSINVMSLLAIVLAIGLVVDDAIVMLENIHRHIEKGMTPVSAAIQGSSEIASAVIAMALTLVVVYAPIGFVQGFTAKLFQEFAFTLAGAVVISGFVALTLSPMMCSRILQSGVKSKFAHAIDSFFDAFSNSYKKLLNMVLTHRNIIIVILLIVAVLGGVLFHSLSSEFVPREDQGFFTVNITAPTGSSLQYTDKYTRQIEQLLLKTSGVAFTITMGSASSPTIIVQLKSWQQRDQSPQQIVNLLNPQLAKIPGVDASATLPDVIVYGLDNSDISLHIETTGSYNDLIQPVYKIMAQLRIYPGLENVKTNLKFDSQQYSITINRDLAAELGVNIADIKETLATMMGGKHLTDVESGSTSYQVLLQMQKQDIQSFDAINKLYVRAAGKDGNPGSMIPLSSLVKLTPIIGQSSLSHFNRMRSANITAELAPGYYESDAINYINNMVPEYLKANMTTSYSGKAQQFMDSSGTMGGILVLSFIFIYLVLAAQFRSFIDPFIVILAVPLSIVGGLFALKVTGGTLSLYSNIGIVTLVGLISKHGILITQFINDLRHDGIEMSQAIIDGAATRLRPILMTTAAMVFGTLPLALSTGPGSVGRHEIGWVIVGGLCFGTFFSLFVVPMAYSYLGRYKKSHKFVAPVDSSD